MHYSFSLSLQSLCGLGLHSSCWPKHVANPSKHKVTSWDVQNICGDFLSKYFHVFGVTSLQPMNCNRMAKQLESDFFLNFSRCSRSTQFAYHDQVRIQLGNTVVGGIIESVQGRNEWLHCHS